MDKKHKCKYCGALLSETNSVFVHISRFDNRGKISNSHWMCCKCWDDTRIILPYIEEDKVPEPEQDNARTCGHCRCLIFRQYDNKRGFCRLLRIHRNFDDPCIHEEEMS